MGLTIKRLIYDEDNDKLIPIPSSKFERLFNRDASESLREYSGRQIKYITVVVQLENRKPVSILDMKFHLMKIDKNGRFDIDFLDELNINASKLINISVFESPKNVVDMSSEFAKKQFKQKYSWMPSPTIENRVKEIIFGRQLGS